MKTLLADINSAMLRHCVAHLGGRHGPSFEVVVACDRLEDGSGLALLDEVHACWPHLVRVFCIDRHRLALVRNRLNALRLHHTLSYPLVPAKLELLLLHLRRIRMAQP